MANRTPTRRPPAAWPPASCRLPDLDTLLEIDRHAAAGEIVSRPMPDAGILDRAIRLKQAERSRRQRLFWETTDWGKAGDGG